MRGGPTAVVLGACALAALLLAPAAPAQVLGTYASTLETRAVVAYLDPATLRPTGSQVELGEYHDGWAFSPDGRQVAFGKSPAGSNTRDSVRIVDVSRIELLGTVITPAYVGPLAWLRPNRLVGLVADSDPVVVDPTVPRIVPGAGRRSVGSCGTPPSGVTRQALVVLSTRSLVTVGAGGAIRRVRLPDVPRECFRAALLVDRRADRAWVASPGGGVARVDLRRMRAQRVRVRGRAPRGERLDGAWLGRRRITLAHRTRRGDAGRGVEILDLRSRRRRVIDPRAGAVAVARGTVLAYAGGYPGVRGARTGVRGYSPGGRRRFAVLRRQHIWNVQVAGGVAYALGPGGVWALDARSGRVISRAPAIRDADVELLTPPR
jgi:hypothetical protein